MDLCCTDPAKHPATAGGELDVDLDHDLYDLSDLDDPDCDVHDLSDIDDADCDLHDLSDLSDLDHNLSDLFDLDDLDRDLFDLSDVWHVSLVHTHIEPCCRLAMQLRSRRCS